MEDLAEYQLQINTVEKYELPWLPSQNQTHPLSAPAARRRLSGGLGTPESAA